MLAMFWRGTRITLIGAPGTPIPTPNPNRWRGGMMADGGMGLGHRERVVLFMKIVDVIGHSQIFTTKSLRLP